MTEDSLALQLTPNDVEVLSNMAADKFVLGQRDAAVSLYQRVLALDPRSLAAAGGLSRALEAAGRFAEATAAAERGLVVDPTRIALLARLAQVRIVAGDSQARGQLMIVRSRLTRRTSLSSTTRRWSLACCSAIWPVRDR